MTNFIVDRCYDRYIITCASDGGEEQNEAVSIASDALRTSLEEHRLSGRLRACRVSCEEDSLVVDAEAADGYEDYVAAWVDAMTTLMCTLAERYPEAVSVEC